MGISNSQPVQLGSVETPADAVVPVGLFAVLPGERIPVAGTPTAGGSQIGKSMFNVEPIPAGKRPGDEVVGRAANQPGGFRCRATRVEADTVLARIVRLVEDAQAGKLRPLRYGAGQGIARSPSAPRNAHDPFLMYAAAQRMFARVRTMTVSAEGASKN